MPNRLKRSIIAFLIAALAVFGGGAGAAEAANGGTCSPLLGVYSCPSSAPSYTGPGDIVSGAVGWWGLRGYNAAYATGTNNAAQVCDAATFSVCTNIKILANGNFDTATASGSSSCSVSCVVSALYDQTGNGITLTCGSASDCPTLTFNCLGSLPCMQFNGGGGQRLVSGATVPSNYSQPFTFSGVAERTGNFSSTGQILSAFAGAGTTGCALGVASANQVQLFCYSTAATATQSDSTLHAIQALMDVGSSVANVDGTENTGLTVGSGPFNSDLDIAIGNNVGFSQPWTGYITEAGFWPTGYSTSTQRNNVCHNERLYWGSAGSC
jgi:hypothetical protein